MQVRKHDVYEAKQYTRDGLEAEQVANWCGGIQNDNGCIINVGTDQEAFAKYGDWIVEVLPYFYEVYSADEFALKFKQA